MTKRTRLSTLESNMKTATIVTDSFYNKNRLFNLTDSISNRDNCLYFFHALKHELATRNITIDTADIRPPESADYVFYSDMPNTLPKTPKNTILLLLESELIKPQNWNISNHKRFEKIFTWHDEFVDNKTYFKLNFSNKIFCDIPNKKTKFCTLISGHKQCHHKLELYSKRIEAIRWFETHHPKQFDLYGIGWEKGEKKFRWFNKKFKSYRGPIASKHQILQHYKFAICYENARDIPGYITEKIMDCFFVGTVPIYWGAPNITDSIPASCFIDKRNFESYNALYNYLNTMTDDTYQTYQREIRKFLNSSAVAPFDANHVAKQIADITC